MGQAAADKVTEIDEARHQLELDLQELEDRLPSALRSLKGLVAVLLATGLLAFLLRRLRSKRSPAAEVVVRVVRDDR